MLNGQDRVGGGKWEVDATSTSGAAKTQFPANVVPLIFN